MRHRRHRSQRHTFRFVALFFLFVAAGVALYRYTRPIDPIYPSEIVKSIPTPPANPLAWPSTGQSAVGAVGYGLLAKSDDQTPRPTASVAKLITALVVLEKYPLTPGQQGPTITLTNNDVSIYQSYNLENGSVVLVNNGEQLSEYQMLEAMLIPSANNIADSLAIWAYGSLPQYSTAATSFIKINGLVHTVIGADASGYLPSTQSTADDLVRLGILAFQNPVISQIVAQRQVSLPVAGKVNNVNNLLGYQGINGIKTGNTDQAGGVFVFSAKYNADAAHSVTIIGAVQGTPNLANALSDSLPLLASAEHNFSLSTIITPSYVLAQYNIPWQSASVDAVSGEDIPELVWNGTPAQLSLSLQSVVPPIASNSLIGTVNVSTVAASASSKVQLATQIPAPPWYWRILRRKL